MIKLIPKQPFQVPIQAECITPNNFAGRSVSEISALEIHEGNRKRSLGDLFKIETQGEDSAEKTTIIIRGDLSKVRRIGAKMFMGKISVEGNVGMHLGEEMEGGMITVSGNADSWCGCMMKKGTIEVKGDAGDYIGSAYRGSTQGMNGGTIIVHGNVGNETGYFMRKGLIKIYGNSGQFPGIHMRNGTIFIQGNSEGREGAQMLGGKIIVCGKVPSVLPTFTIDSIKKKVKTDVEEFTGPFYLFSGDLSEGGNGKLYISKTQNPQLSFYEKYLTS